MPNWTYEDKNGTRLTFESELQPSPDIVPTLFDNYYESERDIGGYVSETLAAVPRGFANSFLTMGEGLVELADAGTNLVGLDDLIEDENEVIGAIREGKRYLDEEFGADAIYKDTWANKFGEGVGSFASFFTPVGIGRVLGVAGKGLTALGAGAGASAGAGEQSTRVDAARAAGIDVSQGQEDLSVFFGGGIGTSEAFVPINRLLKIIPKSAYSDSVRKRMVSRLNESLITGGLEGGQEVLAAIAQDWVERGVYNENLPENDSLFDDFTVGGAIGTLADLALRRRQKGIAESEREKEANLREGEEAYIKNEGFLVDQLKQDRAGSIAIAKKGQEAKKNQQPTIDPSSIDFPSPEAIGAGIATPRDIVTARLENGTVVQGQEFTRKRNKNNFTVIKSAEGKDYTIAKNGTLLAGVSVEDRQPQEVIVSAALKNRKLAGDKTTAASTRKAGKTYAEHIRRTLGTAFPTSTTFSAAEIKTEKGQGPMFAVQDTQGQQYGTSFPTYNEAAQLASSLHDEAINHQVALNGLSRIEDSQEFYDDATTKVLQRYNRRINHPEENLIPYYAVNEAAGTITEKGFNETASFEEQLTSLFQGKKMSQGEFNNNLTASQKINQNRISTKGLTETKLFTPKEAKSVLGKNFDKIADIVYFEGKESSDPQITPVPDKVSVKDIEDLLNKKNIASGINSKPVQEMARSFVNAINFKKMTNGERKLFAQRLAVMPALPTRSNLPNFAPKNYTSDQFALATEYVQRTGDINESSILEAAKIDPASPRSEEKSFSILKSMKERGIVVGKKVPAFEESLQVQKDLDKEQQLEEEFIARERPLEDESRLIPSNIQPEEGSFTSEEMEKIRSALAKHMDRFGLKDVGVNLDYALRNAVADSKGNIMFGVRRKRQADEGLVPLDENGLFVAEEFADKDALGYYSPTIQKIFLSVDRIDASAKTIDEAINDLIGTLDHEQVHAMRQLDLWTEKEWNSLEIASRNTKKQDWEDGNKSYLDWSKRHYGDFSPVMQMEEAIAEMTRDLRTTLRLGGKPRTLLEKISEFYRRLISFARGTGYQSLGDIISNIETGVIGGRERGSSELIRTLRSTEKDDRAVPERGIIATESDEDYEGEFSTQSKADFGDLYKRKTVADKAEEKQKINEAYIRLQAGEIDREQYDTIVLGTIESYDFIPEPATDKEMFDALAVQSQKNKINAEVEENARVGLRLDINAYERYDTWVPTIHDSRGKSISHMSTASIKNADFTMLRPRAGKDSKNLQEFSKDVIEGKNKFPFAQIMGNFVNRSPEEAASLAESFMNSPDWIQVGFDPRRHSYFYDRKTGEPVTFADEVIQIGPLVLARNATKNVLPTGEAFDTLYSRGSIGKAREMGMTNTDLLPTAEDLVNMKNGTYKPKKKRSLVQAAQLLQDRWTKATGRKKPFEYNDKNVDILSDMLADEALVALENDSNAIGWYDNKIKSAKSVMRLVEPRIMESKENEALFDFVLAVTSNGQAVTDNFALATEMFRYHMDNGVLPSTKKEFDKGGERNNAMLEAFRFHNIYSETNTNSTIVDFLNKDFAVRDLKKFASDFNKRIGFKAIKVPSAEGASVIVKGSYILGPKIGQGFYQNIRGNYDPLTMDIWWMRMWNRAVGRPFAARKDLQPRRDEIISIALESDGVSKSIFDEVLNKSPIDFESISQDPDLTDQFISDLDSRWQRYFKDYKIENGINPQKPDLFKKTGTFKKNLKDQLQATPKGVKERAYMRQVVDAAKERLKERNYDITTADFQALMWYPEKQLFRALGVQPGRGSDNDYLDAAELLAEKEGVERGRVEEALSNADRNRAVDLEPSPRRQDEALRSDVRRDDAQERPTTGEVGVEMGINVRTDESVNYSDLIVSGQKKYETRDKDSLRPYIGKRVGIVETGSGPANLVGYATVGDPIEVGESEFNDSRDLHLVPEGSKFDIKPGQSKFLYEMLEPTKLDQPIDASGTRGIIARNISALPREDKIMESRVKPRDTTPKPIPEREASEAVEKNVEEAFDASRGDMPRSNFQSSPEAQAIANRKELPPIDPDLDIMYSRAKEPEYDPGFKEITEGLSSDPTPKKTPMDTYIEETDMGPIQAFLTKQKQKYINKYARWEDISSKYHLNQLADSSSIAAVMMTDRAKGMLSAALKFGYPTYKNGAIRVEKFVHDGKQYQGLIGVMESLYPGGNEGGYSLEDLAKKYAILRRSEYLNQNPDLKTPIKRGDEAAIEAAIMKEVNKHINPETGKPVVLEWYDAWQAYNNKTIKFLKDTGMIDEAGAEAWSAAAVYFPFYKQSEGTGYAKGPNVFKGLTGTTNFKSVGKSENPIDVPMLESITRNLSAAIDMGMKNVAQQRVIRDSVKIGISRELPKGAPEGGKNIVTFKVNGVQRKFEMDDPLVYESMMSLGGQDLGEIVEFLGMPANLLRELVTREPGFMIANMLRDTLSAWVTSGASFTPVLSTLKNFSLDTKEMEMLGVVGGYDFKNDIKDIGKFIAKESRKKGMDVGDLGAVDAVFETPGLKMFKSLWDLTGQATTSSDAATRKAVYQDVLKRTNGNVAEAQFQALEVLNFGRRGYSPVAKILTATIPFLNARLQGLDVINRAFKGTYSSNKSAEKGARIRTVIIRGGILAALSSMYYALVSDDEEYESQPDHVRDNNWIIPTGLAKRAFGIDLDEPLKFPIPFEIGLLFKTLPERIARSYDGKDNARKSLDAATRAITSTLEVNAPQIVLPFMEAVTNHNFYTGRGIVPIYLTQLEPALQKRHSTAELAQMIGDTLNISPLKVEHVMTGYTGTIGSYVLMATNSLLRDDSESGPDRKLSDLPVLKRFLAKKQGTFNQSEFYDLEKSVKRATQSLSNLEKSGDVDAYYNYLKAKSSVLSIKNDVNYISKRLKELRDQKNEMLISTMSEDLKESYVDQINKEMNYLTASTPILQKLADRGPLEFMSYP